NLGLQHLLLRHRHHNHKNNSQHQQHVNQWVTLISGLDGPLPAIENVISLLLSGTRVSGRLTPSPGARFPANAVANNSCERLAATLGLLWGFFFAVFVVPGEAQS